MEDLIIENYEEFVRLAQALCSKGYEALPCDEPKQLKWGYLFENEKHEVSILSMRVADWLKTTPLEIREKYFKTREARLVFIKDILLLEEKQNGSR